MKVIFAQGNPGIEYSKTRHNTGFIVLDDFAQKMGVKWKKQQKFNSLIAETNISNERTLLVKPSTFYNESGVSAKKLIDYYKLKPSEDFIVIHDDLSLNFGTIRVRERGSDAGNNGIKSLNKYIGENFVRIRIGILNDIASRKDDATFVLENFNSLEYKQLKENIIPIVIKHIEHFCNGNVSITSDKTN